MTGAEQERLHINSGKEVPFEKWGPYLSERQWGTVREDYSDTGNAWDYFPHDHARSRAYLWGEDGIGGICDRLQDICFGITMWNGNDPILKERLFGLANNEGNHGEDVKELYYHLNNLPSHYYMQYLYKYPQQAFPYNELIEKNKSKSRQEPEFEILDTGIFESEQYFDVLITYAKHDSNDISIRIEIKNRAAEEAMFTLLPTLWFYNRWQYGGLNKRPSIEYLTENSVKVSHERTGEYYFYFEHPDDMLFTENETNCERIFSEPNESIFVKMLFMMPLFPGRTGNC